MRTSDNISPAPAHPLQVNNPTSGTPDNNSPAPAHPVQVNSPPLRSPDNISPAPPAHWVQVNSHTFGAPDDISPASDSQVQVNIPRILKWLRDFWKEVENSSRETQSALMVVAVLISTVTDQAILSPPGGFHDPNGEEFLYHMPKAGTAIMSYDWPMFILVILLLTK